MKIINLAETADFLGVSKATVKNWIRHKYLSPLIKNNNTVFAYNEVKLLKENISKGTIARLNNRANKRESTKKFVPREYSRTNSDNSGIINIADYIIDNSLDIYPSIFILSINLLIKEKLIFNKNLNKLLSFNSAYYKNLFLLNILKDFFNQINKSSFEKKYYRLMDSDIPDQTDALGMIYQSVKSEGDKAKQGSYYTPKNIVDDILSEYLTGRHKVLDPCCGTGQFLLNAGELIKKPGLLYGFDIDQAAVFISKINLIIKFKSLNFSPNIFQINALKDLNNSISIKNLPLHYDLIITNPPWGQHFDKTTLNSLKSLYPNINSLESFSYFLSKSIDMLNEKGTLSFILPESLLNIKTHSDIRRIILDKTAILKIIKLGRLFTNVFTGVIRIDLRKGKPQDHHKIKVSSDSVYYIEQNRFWSNPDLIFDININDVDQRIIDKLFRKKHVTLKDNADWALGIVTGDNKKFIHSRKQVGHEEIYGGKDVNKYFLSPSKRYIHFVPESFQQVAGINKYRAKEKLIYKFISDKLVFAYDNKQRLTINSANILIPKIKNYPIKAVLVLLNSSLYQFVYLKKFNTIKVLRGNLEQLPFPILSTEVSNELISLADKVLTKKTDPSEPDNLIMKIFKITDTEIDNIKKSTRFIEPSK